MPPSCAFEVGHLRVGQHLVVAAQHLAFAHTAHESLEQIVEGVSAGCTDADCALLGGETAIMPDLYAPGEFDMAGFSVGVVEKKKLVDGRSIRPGDVVLGLASAGLHSNGYSLVRRVVFDHAGLELDTYVPELEQSVGEVLMEPTRIYVKPLGEIFRHYRHKTIVRGMAHITGGGLAENIERILPPNRKVRLERTVWDIPPVFSWLRRLGDVDDGEMFRVFNMGIGFVLVVNPYFAESIQRQLAAQRIDSWVIGEVSEGERGVQWAT